MTREKRLGRGLEALLGRIPAAPAAEAGRPADNTTNVPSPEVSHMALSLFDPALHGEPAASGQASLPAVGDSAKLGVNLIDSNPYQPRRDFDPAEMESLVASLQEHGLLQPVVVRQTGDRYQLVAGERRFRAAQQAGWREVPVQVVEADDRRMSELAIVENLHRKDLNALEKASSFQRYLEQYGCTQEELASRLKLDRSTIANLIRLLELPETVQEAVRRGKISQGHARALLPLGDEREQIAFSQRIQREGLSVRQTEAQVQDVIQQADEEPLAVIGRDGQKTHPKKHQSEHTAALEQEFRSSLGLKVSLRHNSRGRGRLVVHFRSHEEFQRLREHICQPQCKPQGQVG